VTSVNDQGSGAHTMLLQVVGHELQIPVERVSLEWTGTEHGPWDRGSSGMSVTHVAGQATMRASRDVRARLAAVAAEYLGCTEDQVELEDGAFRDTTRPESALSFEEVAARACPDGEPVIGFCRYEDWELKHSTGFVAQVAEVEVDPETGQVHVRKVTSATDVGTVLNPIGVTGQLEGAMVMGLGYATTEELRLGERGEVETAGLHEYKLPAMPDIPVFTDLLITGAEGPGPYGAKAVAELTHVCMPPAIANAICDAVGVQLTALPLRPENVLEALSRSAPREEAKF
jgi:CO/xanthine dehydrogenase Mo-binding subunit